MPSTDVSFIFDTACLILGAAESCLTAAGVTLPERRFVSACDPDLLCCDSLIVHPVALREEDDFGNPGGKCIKRTRFEFDLVIARCVLVFSEEGGDPPLGTCALPAAGTVSGDSLNVMTDRWVLYQCITDAIRDAAGQGQPFCCQPVGIESVVSLCGGGCAGSRFRLVLRM